jgi:competence protein ComEA
VVLARIVDLVKWWGWRRAAGGAVGAIGIALIVYFAVRVEPPPIEESIPMPIVSSSLVGSLVLTVHVGGEVNQPGVYSLPSGSRVVDAVTAAGGVTAKAHTDSINLAAPLADAVQVIVPRKGSPAAQQHIDSLTVKAPVSSSLININSATAKELDVLPGVGPATSKAIVETRVAQGPFASAEDLLDVPGIGPAKLAQIRPLITW